MKTIVIIGGMGPQASIYAHKQLVRELVKHNKQACIVHISIPVEPFYASKPLLKLTSQFRQLLGSVKGDVGFIACNTVHGFFDEFQEAVNFRLENIVANAEIPDESTVYCSPTAKTMNLYGDVNYMPNECEDKITGLITDINLEKLIDNNYLLNLVEQNDNTPVFACTELSMRANEEGVKGYDTLQITIEKIVKELYVNQANLKIMENNYEN